MESQVQRPKGLPWCCLDV